MWRHPRNIKKSAKIASQKQYIHLLEDLSVGLALAADYGELNGVGRWEELADMSERVFSVEGSLDFEERGELPWRRKK